MAAASTQQCIHHAPQRRIGARGAGAPAQGRGRANRRAQAQVGVERDEAAQQAGESLLKRAVQLDAAEYVLGAGGGDEVDASLLGQA